MLIRKKRCVSRFDLAFSGCSLSIYGEMSQIHIESHLFSHQPPSVGCEKQHNYIHGFLGETFSIWRWDWYCDWCVVVVMIMQNCCISSSCSANWNHPTAQSGADQVRAAEKMGWSFICEKKYDIWRIPITTFKQLTPHFNTVLVRLLNCYTSHVNYCHAVVCLSSCYILFWIESSISTKLGMYRSSFLSPYTCKSAYGSIPNTDPILLMNEYTVNLTMWKRLKAWGLLGTLIF